MRVLLFEHFCLLFFWFAEGLIRIRVLFEGESYSRIYVSHLISSSKLILLKYADSNLSCLAIPDIIKLMREYIVYSKLSKSTLKVYFKLNIHQ